jgi:anti-sigma regulatory factor (Ser/Thr protein kinase)
LAARNEELMLPNDPQSVGRARDTTRRVLRAAGLSAADIERAALLVSELVTNAIVHARSQFRVRVSVQPVPRVEVEDDSPAFPEPPPPAETVSIDDIEPGGFGMAIVDRLASRWGTERTANGKVVWFELEPQGA